MKKGRDLKIKRNTASSLTSLQLCPWNCLLLTIVLSQINANDSEFLQDTGYI